MQVVDVINGLIELGGAVFGWLNVAALYRDKSVKGMNLFACLYFTLWSLWLLFFYSTLNQWMSLVGGVITALANVVWMPMALYYSYRNRSIGVGG